MKDTVSTDFRDDTELDEERDELPEAGLEEERDEGFEEDFLEEELA